MADQPAGFIPDGFIPDAAPPPPQRLAGVGIRTVSDEEWARMTPQERVQGLLKAAGYGVSHMLGLMGPAATEPVDNPEITLATAALPGVVKGARGVIPSSTRAAGRFQEVMAATKNVPINVNDPGSVALRLQQLAERGGSMPKVARDFLRRVTDPNKGPMVYEEARDFYTNISRLSADEFKRLSPVIRREVGNLRAALNRSLEEAARQTGKLAAYRSAMREYAQRAQLEDLAGDVWTGVKRALPISSLAGATYYGLNKLSDWVRGGE